MCVPCVLLVSRSFTFKQQCRRSDQTLRSLLGAKSSEIDNNNVKDEADSTILGANNAKVDSVVVQIVTEDKTNLYSASDETDTDNLDSELVLDVLPSEIETSSFEEEIELSSLPSETQLSPVTAEDIPIQQQQHQELANVVLDAQETVKKNLSSKFGDYFDEKKMPTDEFIQDILSDDKMTGIEPTFICTSCDLNFESEEKLAAHMHSHTIDTVKTTDVAKNETKNPEFECPECHKIFGERKILKRHLKIHSPIKPHRCPGIFFYYQFKVYYDQNFHCTISVAQTVICPSLKAAIFQNIEKSIVVN